MDTRFSRRTDLTLKVVLKIAKDTGQQVDLVDGNSFEVDIFDVSSTGLGLISKHFLPKGLIVDLDMDGKLFGLSEVMSLKAEICYCNFVQTSLYKCGIRFVDIPEKYTTALANFVSANERRRDPRVKLSDDSEN